MISFVMSGLLFSQALFAYRYRYDGTWDDVYSLIRASDGGYAFIGPLGDRLGIVKLSSSGSVSWAEYVYQAEGDPDVEYGGAIIQTSDGGFAIGACSITDNMLFIKLNSSGGITNYYSYGTSWDGAKSLIQDGTYYVMAGKRINTADGNFFDWYVVKISGSNGTVSWGRRFGYAGGHDSACSILRMSDGGYLIGGTMGDRFATVKITSSGGFSWARIYTGLTAYATSMVSTSDGGVIMVGYTGGDVLVLKIASDGSLSWAKRYDGGSSEEGLSVIQAGDGDYVVGAYTSTGPLVFKISPDGNTVRWSSRLPTVGIHGWAHGTLVQSTDGGYVFGGSCAGTVGSDFMVLKLDSQGQHPNCSAGYPLTVSTPQITASSETFSLVSAAPSRTSYTGSTPSIVLDTVRLSCSPTYEDVEEFAGITLKVFAGGVIFNSPSNLLLSLYSSDGRLVRYKEMRCGENRINLDPGVYFWQAGPYKGKAVVK
ncbi:MAG: hypothetical protein ABIM74_02895 [candidate division WOR-3 bacterium]